MDYHLTLLRKTSRGTPVAEEMTNTFNSDGLQLTFLTQNSEMQAFDRGGHVGSTHSKISLFGPGRVSGGCLVPLPNESTLALGENSLTYPHFLFRGGDNNGTCCECTVPFIRDTSYQQLRFEYMLRASNRNILLATHCRGGI